MQKVYVKIIIFGNITYTLYNLLYLVAKVTRAVTNIACTLNKSLSVLPMLRQAVQLLSPSPTCLTMAHSLYLQVFFLLYIDIIFIMYLIFKIIIYYLFFSRA